VNSVYCVKELILHTFDLTLIIFLSDNLPPTKSKDGLFDCQLDPLPHHPNVGNATHCYNWSKYYTHCQPGDKNPFQGAISFDNIGLAWVAIFLVISLEGWTDIMYYVQDAHSFWDWIYFVLLIVVYIAN